MTFRAILLLAPILVVACGGGSSSGAKTPSSGESSPQLARGFQVYTEQCSTCHAAGGVGKAKNPPLVGDKALADYHSAKDLFDYIKANMPPSKEGSLPDDDYWAVTAWILDKNGILAGKELPANAADVKWNR